MEYQQCSICGHEKQHHTILDRSHILSVTRCTECVDCYPRPEFQALSKTKAYKLLNETMQQGIRYPDNFAHLPTPDNE